MGNHILGGKCKTRIGPRWGRPSRSERLFQRLAYQWPPSVRDLAQGGRRNEVARRGRIHPSYRTNAAPESSGRQGVRPAKAIGAQPAKIVDVDHLVIGRCILQRQLAALRYPWRHISNPNVLHQHSALLFRTKGQDQFGSPHGHSLISIRQRADDAPDGSFDLSLQ